MNDVNMSPIRSINRAINILQTFSFDKTALTIEQITSLTNIPKSTVYRILCTLKARGFVQFDDKTLQYKPGLRLMEFGFLLPHVLDIQKEAEDYLNELHYKTKQTVLMAIKEDDQIAYTFRKESQRGLRFSTPVGQRRPFIFGVLGPPILAFLPETEIERILDSPIDHHTSYTVTDKKEIRQRLKQIKKDGYYIETDETTIGVTGIGAPIFGSNGKPIAGFGVIGPTVHLKSQLEEVKPLILHVSGKVSARMGYDEV